MEKENKEETEKRGNKLVNIIAGSVLGVAALAASGCDYIATYRTYDPYYPRTYYYRESIYTPRPYCPRERIIIRREPRICQPHIHRQPHHDHHPHHRR